MISVGILFGGKSAEHEISLQSAKNVYKAIDRSKFEPVLIGIDKNGIWHSLDDSLLLNSQNPQSINLSQSGDPVAMIPGDNSFLIPNSSVVPKLDVVFPILHGPFGEDGTVQGLLKLANVPFVGVGVLGSAVGMDKDVMKRLFRDAGIPIGQFLTCKSHEPLPPFAEVEKALGNPVFVKPANMGSSVGISKVRGEVEYTAAMKEAFQYDTKVVIEEFIQGREIECAVLGNENPVASVPGEIIPTHDFYSYDAKYLDENGATLEIPAKLDDKSRKQIQELSVKAFKVLCCEGLSRLDFFLKENGEILINEINTMPGFTKISMYPKLWEASGIGYTELISRLIELALARYHKEQTIKVSYA
jgi:D-alanine-D-alanine ligase